MMNSAKTSYEKYYENDDYYWGIDPAKSCYEVEKLMPQNKNIKLLDIGCGEGKDAVYFAKLGYEVTAFDITENGIRKTKKLAEKEKVKINAFLADINNFEINEKFDVIYSKGAIQYLNEELIDDFFIKIKNMTNINGINYLTVFVDKPFIPLAPDYEPYEKMWPTAKLFTYYADWKIERIEERIFDCNSSNIPHKHAMDYLVARKII